MKNTICCCAWFKVEGVCAQKGSQEYEELVNKNTWHFTHSTRLGQPKLIERKN
ncbi:hypothetical protein BTM482_15180 [Helicobacter pylori]